ncbi:DUF3152 domain-containing protein [Winogradskya humida]|nr:DUF3152 domain-containing protein [Actinoplanes humidus]
MPPAADADAVVAGQGAPATVEPGVRRMLRRRQAAVLIFLLIAIVVLVVGQVVRSSNNSATPVDKAGTGALAPGAQGVPVKPAEPTATATAAPTKTTAGGIPPDAVDQPPTKAPTNVSSTGFSFVGGYGPVLGTTGTLRRFKVAVENRTGNGNGNEFAAEVDRILGDPRSWIAGRQFRLQRVPQAAGSEFTIYLSSAKTSEKMCATGGLKTAAFSSCRMPGQVIMNLDRWRDAVPDYDAPLEVYRAYTINHEVGHQLGHSHEACPGKGKPAPVMMQQTYGLNGCVANAWAYLDGKRYAGNPID